MENQKRYESITEYVPGVNILVDRSYEEKAFDGDKRIIEATDGQILRFVKLIENKMGKDFINRCSVFKLYIKPTGITPMVTFPLYENGIKSNEMAQIFLKTINEWISKLRDTLDFNVEYGQLNFHTDIQVKFDYQDILKMSKQQKRSENDSVFQMDKLLSTIPVMIPKEYVDEHLQVIGTISAGSVLIDTDLSYLDFAPMGVNLASPDQLKTFSKKLSDVGSQYFNGLKVSLGISYPYGLMYPTPFIKVPLSPNKLEELDTEKINILNVMLNTWMDRLKTTGVISAYNINQNVIHDAIFISLNHDDIIKIPDGTLVEKVKRDTHLINVITSAISSSYDTTGLYTIQSIPIDIAGVKHNIVQVDVDAEANGFTPEKRYTVLEGLKKEVESYLHEFNIKYFGLVDNISINPLIVILHSDDV